METRSWPTKYRGPIAIHAGKKVDREACEREPIKSALAAQGYTADNLPTGAVVAIADFLDCLKVTANGYKNEALAQRGALLENGKSVIGNEYEFGWYEEGRFAWELTDVRQLPEPIPAIGRQGLWNWSETI